MIKELERMIAEEEALLKLAKENVATAWNTANRHELDQWSEIEREKSVRLNALYDLKNRLESIPEVKEIPERMYFNNPQGESGQSVRATPLKIIVGEYEISLAGDNSDGAMKNKCGRLSLIVYRNDEMVSEEMYPNDFNDLVAVVEKYRAIVAKEGE